MQATDAEWESAHCARMEAVYAAQQRERLGLMQPPHCVTMKVRYSGNIRDVFYFDTDAAAKQFIRTLRDANYAGTSDTDYTLTYKSTAK